MKKLAVIDGNSILNRAFYGIMSSKMLQTADGTFTNAVYGFLSILFKLEEDLKLLQQAILKERTKEDGDSYNLEIEYKNKLTLFKEHPLIVNYLEDKEQLIAYLEYMQTYIQGLLD